MGATGSFFWAFGDNSGASSWNEYFAVAGPVTPLFLDPESVTAGKHMEAIRESVQDYECSVLLQQAIQNARAAGRSGQALGQAEALFHSAADEVLGDPVTRQLLWHEPKDRTLADRVRVKLLQALVALQE